MSNPELTPQEIDAKIELATHFSKVTGAIEALGLVLNMDVSDVNPFESSYAYTTDREDDESTLGITRFEHVDFHGAPVTTHQYLVRFTVKQADAEGLRLVEEFELVHDEVTDESKLGEQTVVAGDSDAGLAFAISGDFQPQDDRVTHRKTLGEFDEKGASAIPEFTFTDRTDLSTYVFKPHVYKEQEKLTDKHAILDRLEEILEHFKPEPETATE